MYFRQDCDLDFCLNLSHSFLYFKISAVVGFFFSQFQMTCCHLAALLDYLRKQAMDYNQGQSAEFRGPNHKWPNTVKRERRFI